MLTETQKKFWFEVWFHGEKIGEGDEEARLEIVRNFRINHPEIDFKQMETNYFTFKLVKVL